MYLPNTVVAGQLLSVLAPTLKDVPMNNPTTPTWIRCLRSSNNHIPNSSNNASLGNPA